MIGHTSKSFLCSSSSLPQGQSTMKCILFYTHTHTLTSERMCTESLCEFFSFTTEVLPVNTLVFSFLSPGSVYTEMLHNILQPLVTNPAMSIVRYDVHHTLQTSANSLIGRAAHIAVLDSELFIEKFMMVAGLSFFS